MISQHLLIVVAAGICASPLFAADNSSAAPAAPSASTATDVKVAGYRLKNRSSFSGEESQRPPFWPIGFTPKPKGATAEKVIEKVQLNPQWFAVSSILLGPPALAVINGRPYAEGDLLRTPRASAGSKLAATTAAPATATAVADAAKSAIPADLRIRVARIGDGFVTLQYEDQLLKVPLRRSELTERKSMENDVLLPPDERP